MAAHRRTPGWRAEDAGALSVPVPVLVLVLVLDPFRRLLLA
jgi:hypothetical protein